MFNGQSCETLRCIDFTAIMTLRSKRHSIRAPFYHQLRHEATSRQPNSMRRQAMSVEERAMTIRDQKYN